MLKCISNIKKVILLAFLMQYSIFGYCLDLISEQQQQFAFDFVLKEMNYKYNEKYLLPKILNSELIDSDKYKEICSSCENKRINLFVPPYNEIWVLSKVDLSVVVHELVHYVQYFYEKETDGSLYYLEEQAVDVQNKFKEQYGLIKLN